MEMTTATLDAEVYWEAIGAGPAVLLIAGTPGYGGQFGDLADALAADHLVVTYDRRGTGRSPAPPGWSRTTVAEQADDAAGVLARVGVPNAVAFGTSNGAAVALELALRHPARVQRAIVHEIPMLSVVENPAPVASAIGALIAAGMGSGGARAALDAFLRFAFGDGIVDGWTPELRNRMLADAGMVFETELPAFQAYRPDVDALRRCQVPVDVVVGDEEPAPFFHEAARWLADRLGTDVRSAPGGHGAHFSHPTQLAQTVRDLQAAKAR